MIQINLLPVRAERRKEFIRKQLSIVALTLVFTVSAIGFLYYRTQNQYNSCNSAIQRTNKKIKHYDPIIKKIDDYKRKKIEISKKISVIIDLDRYRLAPVVILSDLNQQKPEKLWFTNLQESGNKLTISGIAVDNETIVTFLNNLKKSAPLKKADLILLRSKKMNELELKEFTIQCPLDLKTFLDTLKAPENIPGAKPKENQNG